MWEEGNIGRVCAEAGLVPYLVVILDMGAHSPAAVKAAEALGYVALDDDAVRAAQANPSSKAPTVSQTL